MTMKKMNPGKKNPKFSTLVGLKFCKDYPFGDSRSCRGNVSKEITRIVTIQQAARIVDDTLSDDKASQKKSENAA
jgi:hypothetical protein